MMMTTEARATAMRPIRCLRCHSPFPPEQVLESGDRETACPRCGTRQRIFLFPAIFHPPEAGNAGETVVLPDEATCFYHPDKRAAVVCEGCGRFLCALCDLEMRGKHLCPSCLDAGLKGTPTEKDDDDVLSPKPLTRYDQICLALATLPLLFVWPVIVTAPITLFLVFHYRNRQCSLVGRPRITFAVAGIIAVIEIALGIFLVGSMLA